MASLSKAVLAEPQIKQRPRPFVEWSVGAVHFPETLEWEQEQGTIVRHLGSILNSGSGSISEFSGDHTGSLSLYVFRYEQTRPNLDLLGQLRILQQHYTIVDSDDALLELLEEEPSLFPLLVEAVGPLRIAFGEKCLFHIRVQHSDDESLLKVAVRLPAGFGEDKAEQGLRDLDDGWWRENCGRSGGALVIDYEIQDGV